MKKEIFYVCSECGEEFSKWSGMCSNCKQWNTLKEYKESVLKTKSNVESASIISLDKVADKDFKRLTTGFDEIDRVLGGGVVAGSVVLVGGDPGIGKSTLITQMAQNIQNSLYVSGEESLEQLKLRVKRLGIKPDKIIALANTNVDVVAKTIVKHKPQIVIIDSIQTMYTEDYPSTPGSLVQVRECGLKMQKIAKSHHIPLILIGHVTKDGAVAGPKILEHMVDVVLYLEGERYQNNRILRSRKNRFGSVDEIGVFEMCSRGMQEVKNPSKLFLEERKDNIAGSCVSATVEGNRPILIEVQALVSESIYGFPKRTVSGFDLNRLNLLLAILGKRVRINFGKYDVYINIVGGFKIKDPGVDLAVCMAVVSAFYNIKVPKDYCFIGEVGLSGEIRKVKFQSKRQSEAKRLGFDTDKNNGYIQQFIREIFKKQ